MLYIISILIDLNKIEITNQDALILYIITKKKCTEIYIYIYYILQLICY